MSVTITITVSPTGAAAVGAGAEVTGEAPPPTLFGGPGDAAGEAAAKEAAEGPAPLEPEELGLSAVSETGGDTGGPPPEDFEGAVAVEPSAEAPEPRPIEDLEKASGSTRTSTRKPTRKKA
jgi:hypothetical protein